MENTKLLSKQLVVGPFQCNCHILACARTGDALIIDPGDEAPRIVEAASKLLTPSGMPIRVRYLVHTHAHLDHVGGTRGVREAFEDARIALHREDETIYRALKMQGEMFGLKLDDPLEPDHWLQDGDELRAGDLKLEVLHTPGHSPGGVCLQLEDRVFTGDTLFQGSIGRTDLWGGDLDLLLGSIRDRLLTLDPDTRVFPGHGLASRIGVEAKGNPFLN